MKRVAALVACVLVGPRLEGAEFCDTPRPWRASLAAVPAADEWFSVYRAADGVFAIVEPYQFQEVISYLVVGSDSALLFDTGMGLGPIRKVVESLTRLPVRVLNSHTHFDHVGGNADFERVLALDTPFTRRNAEGQAHDVVKGEVAPEALCRPLPAGTTADTYRIRPFKVMGWIKDGESLDLGTRRLEVLSVPGHTPDALALLDRAAGLLFTGDTFYEGQVWLIAPETDLDAYQRSVDRLAALVPQLKKLLPAHNAPLAAPARLLQLQAAVGAIRSGRAQGQPRPERQVEYLFDGFSMLLSSFP